MNPFMLTLEGTVILAAPLILAAIGGLLSERGGVVDISLEGKMLISTIATVLAAYGSGNPYLGILAGVTASVALSFSHWLFTQKYQIDHIVSGMAVNAIAFGSADYLAKRFLDPGMNDFAKAPLPLFWSFSVLLPFFVWFWSKKTQGGLRLTAIGNDPDKARQMGLSPITTRLKAAVVSGLFCGIAGALLVSNSGSYENGMTAGKGFIALAALIVGGWKPIPTLLACLGVGLLQQLRITFQGVPVLGVEVPGWIWISLPYLATVIALAGFLGRVRPPAGLGKS